MRRQGVLIVHGEYCLKAGQRMTTVQECKDGGSRPGFHGELLMDTSEGILVFVSIEITLVSNFSLGDKRHVKLF